MAQTITPIHPGEHLAEMMQEYGLSQYRVAKEVHVPAMRIHQIIHGKRSITADTALRLGRYFSMNAQFWLNLQARYDMEIAETAISDQLDSVVPLAA